MRLSVVYLFKKTVNGHIFRGKERLVKPVSLRSMDTLRREFEQQEKNMSLLRHPYLTLEQSSGHAKALGKTEAKMEMWKQKQLKMKPHVTLEGRLAHLKIKDAWD